MSLLSSVKLTSILAIICYINLIFITVFIIFVALIHSALEKIIFSNMKCDNNSTQSSNSGETYSGYFMPHPGQDDKNRNHVGGSDPNRRVSTPSTPFNSNTSSSSWSSTNLENSNYR